MGVFGPSLLTESTNSMILNAQFNIHVHAHTPSLSALTPETDGPTETSKRHTQL